MNGAEKLRLVHVCDRETGVCLFQRAWQWRGDQDRSSIGKLVLSFYQFAREVDQGGMFDHRRSTTMTFPNVLRPKVFTGTAAVYPVMSIYY